MDARSKSSVETMDDMQSCIPRPSSTILSVPSECHGVTSCDTVPASSTTEITPTAVTSLVSVQTSDVNLENNTIVFGSSCDEKYSTSYSQESSTLPLDAQSDSSVETMDDMRSCIPGPSSTILVPDIVTTEITTTAVTSLVSVETSDMKVEKTTSVSGSSCNEKYSTSHSQESSTLPLDAQSDSSVETMDDMRSCIPGPSSTVLVPDSVATEINPTAVTSLVSVETSDVKVEKTTSVSGSSCDEKYSTSYSQESSTLPLDAQSDSSVETMDDMQSCIPGPSSTIFSVLSECHVDVTSCDTVPDSATTEITTTAQLNGFTSVKTSDVNVEITTSVSGSSRDEKCSTSHSQESSTLPLNAQSDLSVEIMDDMGSCLPGPSSTILVPDSVTTEITPTAVTSLVSVETSDVKVEKTTSVSGSSCDEKYSTSHSQESSTSPLDAQSDSSVETMDDMRSCIPGPSSTILVPDSVTTEITTTAQLNGLTSVKTSDVNVEITTSVSGSSRDEKCSTSHIQESSTLPLNALSDLSVETMDDMGSCIPGPSSTILVPDSVTTEITPTAVTSLVSVETSDVKVEKTTSVSGSSCDEKYSISDSQESSTLLLDAQSNSSGETVDDMRSCIPGPSSTILSVPSECHGVTLCDTVPDSVTTEITPTALTSVTGSQTSDRYVENTTSVSGSSRDEKCSTSRSQESSTLPLDAQSDSSVETMDDMQSCIPGPSSTILSVPSECQGVTSCDTVPDSVTTGITPTAVTSLVSVETTGVNVQNTTSVSGSSRDEKYSISNSQESSTLPLEAQSNLSSVVDCQTGSQVLDEMPPSDPNPPSAPTCVPGSAAIRPPISVEVTPPAIPSLMSIQTTPPPWWCDDYVFGPRFPAPYRYPMPRNIGASRPHRNTSPTHGGTPVRQQTPVMDVQTTGATAVPAIPPLMSIQTRPPWEARPPWGTRPPRGNRPPRGTRRRQARG